MNYYLPHRHHPQVYRPPMGELVRGVPNWALVGGALAALWALSR